MRLHTHDRKYKATWTGTLNARVIVLSNEVPRLADQSGALASRFVVLPMTRSFYGKEDRALDSKLSEELAGILNWSIAGWQRLQERSLRHRPSTRPATILPDAGNLNAYGSPNGPRRVINGSWAAIRSLPLFPHNRTCTRKGERSQKCQTQTCHVAGLLNCDAPSGIIFKKEEAHEHLESGKPRTDVSGVVPHDGRYPVY